MVPTLADKQSVPIVVSADFTAQNNGTYIAIATLTVTDPTPSVGANYIVHIRNGTATIGGVGYAAGQDVHRVWHSGSWTSTPMPSRAATVTASRLTEFDASGNLQDSAITDSVTGGVATLAATLTGNVSYTFPPSSITVAGINLAQTWTAAQTISSSSNSVFVGLTAQNTNSGNAAASRLLVTNDTGSGISCLSYSSTYTGTVFGLTAANLAVISIGGASSSALAIGVGSNVPVVMIQAGVERGRIDATNVTWTLPNIVPNGTAAAPGLRLTSEASGLYRVSATSLGFSVAGTAAASLTSAGVFTLPAVSGATLVISSTSTSQSAVASNSAYTLGGFGAAGPILSTSNILTNAEDTYIGVDALSTPRLGFVKKTGAAPKLCYGNGISFAIATSNGANIAASSTFTDRLTISAAGVVAVTDTTASTSTTTGALTVAGGLGVAGALYIGGTFFATGTLVSLGGADAVQFGVQRNSTTASVSLRGGTTGASVTAYGGSHASLASNVLVDADTVRFRTVAASEWMRFHPASSAVSIGATTLVGSERLRVAGGSIAAAGSTDVIIGGGALAVGATTASTSTTTGALTVAGGLGVAGAGYFGGGVSCTTLTTSGTFDTDSVGVITATRTAAVTSGTVQGVRGVLTCAPASASSAIFEGTRCSAETSGAQNFTSAFYGIRGVSARARHAGTGTVTSMTGLVTDTGVTAAGVITTLEQVRVATVTISGGGSIGTLYGLRVADQIGASTNYAISTGSGIVQIGDTTASTSTTTGALTCAGGGAFAKELVTGLGLWLVDGQTAPGATSGYAKIYVDTADGDLKIIFGDGTIKTIVTDT